MPGVAQRVIGRDKIFSRGILSNKGFRNSSCETAQPIGLVFILRRVERGELGKNGDSVRCNECEVFSTCIELKVGV